MGFTSLPALMAGSSGSPPYRPTTAAFSTTGSAGTPTHTNDALAYDTSTATFGELKVVGLSTAVTGTVYAQIAVYSGVSGPTFTGTLKVLVTSTTQTTTVGTATATSSVSVDYSLNGGSTWTNLGTMSGGTDWSLALLTHSVTGQNLANLQVRCTARGDGVNNGPTNRTKADATLDIYDIRVE